MKKNFLLLGLGTLLLLSQLTAKDTVRRFKVHYRFDIQHTQKLSPAKLWNPMPYNSTYQQVRSLTFSGNYDHFLLNRDNAYDADILYADWKKSDQPKKIAIDLVVETKERSVPISVIEKASRENLPLPKKVQHYLKPTSHIPTDGIIKGLADRITQGKTDRFEKVKTIYYWCTSHTFRDSKVKGCGTGDVGKLITQKKVEDAYKNGYYGGKCTDLSSLFTALCRAAGIPAREVFGIRLGKSYFSKALGKSDDKGFATISTWQHCRAEYYIPGAGWIPADPADITKLELVEDRKLNDPKVQKLNDKYLHSWEMNWVALNHARDFVLSPKPRHFPLNMLGYPYGEVNDHPLDYYDPEAFGYTITAQEIK